MWNIKQELCSLKVQNMPPRWVTKKCFFQHINNRWKVTLYQLKIISCINLRLPSLLLLWKTNFKKQHYKRLAINSSNFFIWIYELLHDTIRTFLLICILFTLDFSTEWCPDRLNYTERQIRWNVALEKSELMSLQNKNVSVQTARIN